MPWFVAVTIRIFLALILVYLYIGWRISGALSILLSASTWSMRAAVLIIGILLNLFPIIIILIYLTGLGDFTFLRHPEPHLIDYVLIFPFWLGLILVVEVLPYFLTLEIVNAVVKFIPSISIPNWQTVRATLLIAIVALFAVYIGIRTYLDTYRVRLQAYQVELNNLPSTLENLSLSFFSDIQVDKFTQERKLSQFEKKLKASNSELMLFAGDLVTSGQEFIDQGLGLMCDTAYPPQKFACLGDHDHWSNPSRITSGLSDCGWTFLRNEHRVVKYKGSRILITGITYIYSQRLAKASLTTILEEKAPPSDLKILLVHQPSPMVIETAQEYGYDLVLAGHTHGGQVVFRPFGFSLTLSQFESIFYTGYHRYKDMPVVVTNGIGLTLAPLRYHAPAEVCKITLVKK